MLGALRRSAVRSRWIVADELGGERVADPGRLEPHDLELDVPASGSRAAGAGSGA